MGDSQRTYWHRIWRAWLVGLFLCLGILPAFAQLLPKKDASFPDKPHPGQYHFDAGNHKLWHFRDGGWEPFPSPHVAAATPCNGFMVVRQAFNYMLGDASGRVVVARSPQIRCMGPFVMVSAVDERIDYFLNAQADTVAAIVGTCAVQRDSLAGEEVFCFPEYVPGLERFNCFKLKNWGMMNGAGKWVIPPKFDHPFKFENGVAEVTYMGALAHIDEAGNFLPEAEDADAPQRANPPTELRQR